MAHATTIFRSLEANRWRLLYQCRYDREHREATIPVLAGLLEDKDLTIRQRAMRAVVRIGHCDTPGALAKLVPLLCRNARHEDELTRRTAIGALHAIGCDNPKPAIAALTRACDDETLLQQSLLALIEIGTAARRAAPTFHRFAQHGNGKIRRLVMRGLAAIGADDSKSHSILKAGLSDPNKSVQQMARKALARMKNQGS